MNLSSAVRTAKNVITANSPVLLVGAAIAGVFTTGVLAACGGYKARGIVEEERGRRLLEASRSSDGITVPASELAKVPDLTNTEKFKLTWLCYAVPAVTGASTIAAVIGVHAIHTKRNAAMAALYAMATEKLDTYREKAEELMGGPNSKKSQEANDAMAQRSVDKHPFNHEVVILGPGKELCQDEWSGRYFEGSMPIVETAIANVNTLLAENGNANLNEFYDFVGLPTVPMGEEFGWSGRPNLAPRWGKAISADGRPVLVVAFQKEPQDLGNK